MGLPLDYMLEKLDQGFSFEFLVRDAGIQRESLLRRFDRARAKGLLNKRHIALIWGNEE